MSGSVTTGRKRSLPSLNMGVVVVFLSALALYAVISLTMFVHIANNNRHSNHHGPTVPTDKSTFATSSTASSIRASSSSYSKKKGVVESRFPSLKKDQDGNEEEEKDKVKKTMSLEDYQRLFPIPVDWKNSNEIEVIAHPGYPYASQTLLNDKDLTWNMTVPKFWNPSDALEGKHIREYLGDYGKRLMTRQEASSIGSKIPNPNPNPRPRSNPKANPNDVDHEEFLETIYIAIATYRDPECINTINSLFLRATYPERIRVAVIDQRMNDSNDPSCLQPTIPCSEKPNQVLCRYRDQIDGLEMNAKLAIGPVFARHVGYRFYRGEYFAIQMDSHVRFVQDWDVDIIAQWKSANNEMAVLSTYLSDLNGSIDPETHEGLRTMRPILCDAIYEGQGSLKHLRLGQQPERPSALKGHPILHPFWAAGFSFSRGHFVIQVPYDQYLPMIFQGEEIAIGVRGFTFGYDYYAPERSVCFHMYAVDANKEKRDKVPHFWEHQNDYPGAEIDSMRRLNTIIGMWKEDHHSFKPQHQNQYHYHDQNTIQQLESVTQTTSRLYGVGQVRHKQKFFQTFGINTQSQTVEKSLCNFAGISMYTMFTPHIRGDRMGIDYDQIHFQWKTPAETLEQERRQKELQQKQEEQKRKEQQQEQQLLQERQRQRIERLEQIQQLEKQPQ